MWWIIAAFFVALVASYAFMPTPKSQKPAGISEVTAPTAEDGREIPVAFGSPFINGPNVVWYGDLKTKAIKAKGGKK